MNAQKSYTQAVNEGRIELIKEIDALQSIDADDLEENENYRSPLCIDTLIVKKIVLSTGGPEDGFKLFFSSNKELLYGVYYRADWGEYKESDLSNDEAQLIYDFYLGGYFE